jgi:hypothetical protein
MGNRFGHAMFADQSGYLYLIGGQTQASGYRNDIWRFRPSSGVWHWLVLSSDSLEILVSVWFVWIE